MTNRKRVGILSTATAILLGLMLLLVAAQANEPPAAIGPGEPVSGDGITPTDAGAAEPVHRFGGAHARIVVTTAPVSLTVSSGRSALGRPAG